MTQVEIFLIYLNIHKHFLFKKSCVVFTVVQKQFTLQHSQKCYKNFALQNTVKHMQLIVTEKPPAQAKFGHSTSQKFSQVYLSSSRPEMPCGCFVSGRCEKWC